MMDVNVNELRDVANKLFDHLLQSGHEMVTIPHDYYWSIPSELRHDPYSQPKEFTLGQFSSDIEELSRINNGTDEPFAFALVWLASIIREIGEITVV